MSGMLNDSHIEHPSCKILPPPLSFRKLDRSPSFAGTSFNRMLRLSESIPARPKTRKLESDINESPTHICFKSVRLLLRRSKSEVRIQTQPHRARKTKPNILRRPRLHLHLPL